MPGQPLMGDLHVNRPLSNLSVKYNQQGNFVNDKVFPVISVQNQSDMFWKYPKGTFYRMDVEPRGPGAETAGVGYEVELDAYYCPVYGLHFDIPDMVRANADSVFSLDRDATEILVGQMQRKRELLWASRFFTTGVWGTDLTGVASGTPTSSQFLRWDNDSSDPVEFIENLKVSHTEGHGYTFNTLVVGPYVLPALKHHPAIQDRIKYTQRAVITEDLLASMFGVDRLLVANAIQATDREPTIYGSDPNMSYIFGKSMLLTYTNGSPSPMTPSAGYQFQWNGYHDLGGGSKIKKFRLETIASDRIEIEASFDMRVVCPDLGVFMTDVVS